MADYDKAIDIALRQCGEFLVNEAKKRCPVDTGILRNSISYEVDGDTLIVGTNLYYAPYVELGTGLFAVNGDGRQVVPWAYLDQEGNWHATKGQHPQPYLKPSLDDNKAGIVKLFYDKFSEEMKNG